MKFRVEIHQDTPRFYAHTFEATDFGDAIDKARELEKTKGLEGFDDTWEGDPWLISWDGVSVEEVKPTRTAEHATPIPYLVSFGGGSGPNVWDNELEVSAKSIHEALQLAEPQVAEANGVIFSIEQKE